MELIIDIFTHIDVYLNLWAGQMGLWFYVLLFLIIFCETGLVVTPFLPGDSLLFALGALAARVGSPIDLFVVIPLLIIAAILGNKVNYLIGRWVGPKVFAQKKSIWFNKKYLEKTHNFYETYGGKTIILSRFIPIFRTFAPFVAGIGKMTYLKFNTYNIVGAVLWVGLLTGLGYYFSETPLVKDRFHLVILMVIIISILPPIIEYIRHKYFKK
ncbi:MAG: DedA family protein [Elusimicrobiaceae bacterium]|jgi:membrane-associated protein|nr:DedA family protein [Elusimicrobiaceae bacterium]MBT3955487.1 DedA family protein [Elusimicrobiaceae bacterium]MBT4008557.1 DedA family protein [Elusimicrobiaceae bacterium]MBT4402370.1 DedA family protein [Elusimicrobiaceae bacterium]MBT5987459.1 DedA family protein [Elusimicrobiaceae bacterium]